MALQLDQIHEAVRKTAREFADNELEPIRAEWQRKREFPPDVLSKMAEFDLRGIMAPEEYGGPGMGMLGHAIAVEEVSRVWPSVGIKMDEPTVRLLRMVGTDDQKETYLPGWCDGEIVGALALSEPGHGSDFAGIVTRADAVEGGYVLNGEKTWITNAGIADVIVVAAKTEPDDRHSGITLFLVDPETEGVDVGEPIEFIGYDASHSHEVRLQDCFVPEANVLGETNRGFYHTMEMLSENRVSVAARALGIAVGAFEEAVSYASERTAFGQEIAEFQAIRHEIADMKVKIENARHLVYNAARLCDDGEPFDTEASMAKLYAAEAAHEIASQALNVHGANGYTRDYPVQMFYRDAKGVEIYEGTSEIQRDIIARDVFDGANV